MAGQEFQKSQLAGDMQKALWQQQLGASGQNLDFTLGKMNNANQMAMNDANNATQMGLGKMNNATNRYGMDQNYALGLGGQDVQRYGMDQNYALGLGQQDYLNQGQNFDQMMGLEGIDFRNRQYNDQQNMYQDQLTQALLGQNPRGAVSQEDMGSGYAAGLGSANQNSGAFGKAMQLGNMVGGFMPS
jgi:hypothetical protein